MKQRFTLPNQQEWIQSQNKIFQDFTEQGSEFRSNYKARFDASSHVRLTELWDYPKHGCPWREGDQYYHYFNTGLQSHSVLYVEDLKRETKKVFIDPNKMSDDGTTALKGTVFSKYVVMRFCFLMVRDGKYCAYTFAVGGSDWATLKVKNCETLEDEPDTLEWLKFSSISWTHDNKVEQ